jgi:molybdopterin molybdotransferase
MTDKLHLTTPTCTDAHDSEALSAGLARQRILDAITPLGEDATESLPLLQVLDRVLSADIIAGINVPPHNNSAMDGYGLNARDLPQSGIGELRVVGQVMWPFNYDGDHVDKLQMMR